MSNNDDKLRDEYPEDLIRGGERGKYASRYRESEHFVAIDPELHKIFPDAESVNKALREYAAEKKKSAP